MLELTDKTLRSLLESGHNQYWLRLHASLLDKVSADFTRWPAPPAPETKRGRTLLGQQAQRLVQFFVYDITQKLKQISAMGRSYAQYCSAYARAASEQERRQVILAFAKNLGATRKQLRRDKRAFARWFGHDALSDRYQRRHLTLERQLSFRLECMAKLAALALAEDGESVGYEKLWRRLDMEAVVKPILSYDGDQRVTTEAFHCLSTALMGMPREFQQKSVGESTLQYIFRSALQPTQLVWIQCEALQLLQSLSPDSLEKALHKRLTNPHADEDIFFRHRAVILLGNNLAALPQLEHLVRVVCNDPSPYVRQAVAEILPKASFDVMRIYLPPLVLDDTVVQVRAAGLLTLSELILRGEYSGFSLQLLLDSLTQELDEFVLRVALKTCIDCFEALSQQGHSERIGEFYTAVMPPIEKLHQRADSLSVRRWASQTREKLWCMNNDEARSCFAEVHALIDQMGPGQTRRLSKKLYKVDDAMLGRVMSVVAQDDFGCEIESSLFGRYITRGHVFGFRFWRLIHEFRNPSPDKRQAHSHTVGRQFYGRLRAPSAIVSELAETKVPGEPLFMSDEGGWRGYIPLVDEALSALHASWLGKPVYLYHSEGVTELTPPRSWVRRMRAWIRLTQEFRHYAHLRNWNENGQETPDSYLQALKKLGFKIIFRGHATDITPVSEDAAVKRFFPATFVLPDPQMWSEFQDYFFSIYENSLYELGVFLAVGSVFFVGRHIYQYRKIQVARAKIPLVVGGWGTRGKSGTERIKAALLNALGFGIVSKTSGCEAMFLHAHPYGDVKEMFLFRPYDKATIWEQHNLVCLAEQLDCEVFLWECMGLTPSYVELLQRQWMRDDIATITNTYPDHEDLQGPAGINIPQVMTNFIPRQSTLLTSEEQMYPILETAARELGTDIHAVDWLQSGLLSPDVLERFPYDEHPFNIALVLKMADELEIPRDYALKEMADRVVADLGVLKTYPCAPWRSRRLEFVNGMSANERFGCLGNWTRLNFAKADPNKEPGTWITLVINNRADRVSRSRVFGSIVAKDINFDRCILIGNNLAGFKGYIREAWAEWVSEVNLTGESSDTPESILLAMAKRFRVPYSEAMVKARLEVMLTPLCNSDERDKITAIWQQPEQIEQCLGQSEIGCRVEIIRFLRDAIQLLQIYQSFAKKLEVANNNVSDVLNEEFRELLWLWFEQKLFTVEDYYATGDKVIEYICDQTPPGFYNRIIGMQNIKGTGLDFVYRWQAWETCYEACEQLASPNVQTADKGLRALVSFQEYGVVCEETVRETVSIVRARAFAQNERYQAELKLIMNNLAAALKKVRAQMTAVQSDNKLSKLVEFLEAFLDAGDAVKRRKKANQIYQDLAAERISHDRAVLELQVLNKRQKGGWLTARFRKSFN